jgi:ribosome-associated protein YbcJ (S4-like RNA binding protein)
MEDQDTQAMESTAGAEHAQAVQDAVAQTIAADLPRMVRSDVTRLTEMIAKYAGLPGTFELLEALVAARGTMLEFTAVTQGFAAPPLAGSGVDSSPATEGRPAARPEPKPAAPSEPWDTPAPMKAIPRPSAPAALKVANGGRDVLLTTALVQAGFVSSTGRAKIGIREGYVRVNGEVVRHDGALLSPGTHTVQVGDGDPQQVEVT